MIKKYKSIEEASQDLWVTEPDEKYYVKLKNFYAFVFKHSTTGFRRGIFKFKTMEEANKHRDEMLYGTKEESK